MKPIADERFCIKVQFNRFEYEKIASRAAKYDLSIEDVVRYGCIADLEEIYRTTWALTIDALASIEVTEWQEHRKKRIQEGIDEGKTPFDFPPIDVSREPDGSLFLSDGQHRLAAYRRIGFKRILVTFSASKPNSDEVGDGADLETANREAIAYCK